MPKENVVDHRRASGDDQSIVCGYGLVRVYCFEIDNPLSSKSECGGISAFNMASKIPLQPGQVFIGFMNANGTLIGSLAKPNLGHDLLASQLGVRMGTGLQPGIFAITVGKMPDGTIHAFGSGTFGPLPDHLKALAKGLVQ